MKSKNDVEVLINGRKYTICGFESAEYLQKVATYINGKYAEFKNQDYYYSLDMDLRNILLAINIADDYFKSEHENQALVRDNERKDKMVLDMKHEVLAVQSKSDDVVNRKDELKEQLDEAEKRVVELNVKNEDNSAKVFSLEEKLSKVEAENSSHATKLEAALEKIKKLESENTRVKKKNDTLGNKVKTLETRNAELKKQFDADLAAQKAANDKEKKEFATKYERAKADLVKKYEEAKAEMARKYESANEELKGKLEEEAAELREVLELENKELGEKLEAAEKHIKELESRTRRGKR